MSSGFRVIAICLFFVFSSFSVLGSSCTDPCKKWNPYSGDCEDKCPECAPCDPSTGDCQFPCDLDDDGIEDSCYICDSDGDGEPDDCLQCDTDDDGINDSCYTCDSNGDGINDSCYVCDLDEDDVNESCYTCDANGDGVNDQCYQYDLNEDGIKETCGADCVCSVWHEIWQDNCTCCSDGGPTGYFILYDGMCVATTDPTKSCEMLDGSEGASIFAMIDNCDDPLNPTCDHGALLQAGMLFRACSLIMYSHSCGQNCYWDTTINGPSDCSAGNAEPGYSGVPCEE